jgi:hypothetical protein
LIPKALQDIARSVQFDSKRLTRKAIDLKNLKAAYSSQLTAPSSSKAPTAPCDMDIVRRAGIIFCKG